MNTSLYPESDALERLLAAAMTVSRQAYLNGITGITLPLSDNVPYVFRIGINLLVNGLDLETTLEILRTLLYSSGPELGERSLDFLEIETIKYIAFGEDPATIRARIQAIVSPAQPLEERPVSRPPVTVADGDGPLIFRRDLDQSDGPIETTRDVMIFGHVRDGAVIRTTGSATITGNVGEAVLETGGNVSIEGVVHGKGKGRIRCAGDLRARALERVEATATGDIQVSLGAAYAKLTCGGNLACHGLTGAIFGGSASAGLSVSAARIGALYCSKTRVAAGVPGLRSKSSPQSAAAEPLSITARDTIFSGVHVEVKNAALWIRSDYTQVTMRADGYRIVVAPSAGDGGSQ